MLLALGNLSLDLFMHPSSTLSIYLSIYMLFLSFFLSVCLSFFLSIYISIYLPTDLSIYRSIYLSLSLSLISVSMNLSLYPSIDPSGLSLGPHIIYICLLHLYPSVYLFYLFFYPPPIYKPIDVSKLISLSIHTSRLGAIRFQDDLKAACSFWV